MTLLGNRVKSQSIRIVIDQSHHVSQYDYQGNKLRTHKEIKDDVDYEMSLEYIGLMTRYDNLTWNMYDRIVSYRYHQVPHYDHEKLDNDFQFIVHKETHDEPIVVNEKRANEWHNSKQCHANDRAHRYHDKPNVSYAMNKMTLTSLMKQAMLQTTGKIATKVIENETSRSHQCCYNQHPHNHQETNIAKQTSNMIVNPAKQELVSCYHSPIAASPLTELTTNERNHTFSDVSPKSIMIPHDNSEGIFSNMMLPMQLHPDSSDFWMDHEHPYYMLNMKPPQQCPISCHDITPGYVPNWQLLEESNELDSVFEIDL